MTERTCRGAFRKAGIYPFNPKAVLDEVPFKEIEMGRLEEATQTEPTTGMMPADHTRPALPRPPPPLPGPLSPIPPLAPSTVKVMATVTPNRMQGHPLVLHVDTPHNTAAVRSHVVAVLDELDSLTVQFRVFPSVPQHGKEFCNSESQQG